MSERVRKEEVMICFYHADLDGQCAAAIARGYEVEVMAEDKSWDFLEVNYNLPFPLEAVAPGEPWMMLDYSLPPDQMLALIERSAAGTWIDHHRTALEKLEGLSDVHALRGTRSTAEAGCVLTWQYLFGDDPMPRAVELVGDRDIWRWAFGDETKFFCAGQTTRRRSRHGQRRRFRVRAHR